MSTLVIKKDGQSFDLPQNLAIETEETSPIFHSQGSHTASVVFPSSPRNSSLLGYMHRLDAKELPAQDSDVTVRDGAVIRTGKLNITSAHIDDGYEASIGFSEGRAYNLFNAIKLSELPNLPTYQPDGGLSTLINHLNSVRKGLFSADYSVFTICVANEDKEETNQNGVETTTTYSEYLNEIDVSGNLLSDSRTVQYLVNSEVTNVNIPRGYGITPFLKVHVLLNLIFTSYGYKVAENPFATHYQLRELVVLNNVADTIVKGEINYANIMPNCTINEFLDSLYCRFGMVYFVDEMLSVHIKFLRDILRDNPQSDLSDKRAGNYPVKYTSAARVVLSCNTTLEGTSTTTETYDAFLKQYHYTFSSIQGTDNTLYYNQEKGLFLKGREIITPDTFIWNRGEVITSVEIISIDEAITYLSDEKHRNLLIPSYITGSVKKHTLINSSTVELSESDVPDTPLAFLFSYNDGGCIGLTHITTATGEVKKMYVDGILTPMAYALTFIGEHGHFMQFWREYDAILRHSNHTIEAEFNLNALEISRIEKWRPVSLTGQPLLIESLRYNSPRDSSAVEAVLRTIRLYHPYNLDKEQIIKTSEQIYYWRIVNTMADVINKYHNDIWRTFERGLQDSWIVTSIHIGHTIGDQDIFTDASGMVPPIEYEYLSSVVRLIQTASVQLTATAVAQKHNSDTNRYDYITENYYDTKTFTVSIAADIVSS